MTSTQVKAQAGGAAPAGLGAAAVGSGGSFAAGAQFWKATLVGRYGETAPSNEATATLVLNGSATITLPAARADTQQIKLYRGTVTNTENLLVAVIGQNATFPPGFPATYTDTGTSIQSATPPAAGSFTNVTLDSQGRVPSTDATLAALPAAVLCDAVQAAEEWHNVAGVGDAATRAQKRAAAVGFALQDV